MFACAAAGAVFACARATGDVSGGEESIDPTPPAYVGDCETTETIDAGSGAKWSDLYRDLFGTTGTAKCSRFDCHGAAPGTEATKQLLCVDQAGCRQSMFDHKLVRPDDKDAPEQSNLYQVLRHCSDDKKTQGVMPRLPASYHFSKASMARVAEWIKNGAPSD